MITKFFLSISVLALILFIVWSNSDITRLATKAINPLLPFNPEAKSPSEQKSIKLFNCIDNYYRNENSYLELIEELFCDSISWEYIGPEKRILKSDIKNELGVFSWETPTMVLLMILYAAFPFFLVQPFKSVPLKRSFHCACASKQQKSSRIVVWIDKKYFFIVRVE
jgi:hypothetical protein